MSEMKGMLNVFKPSKKLLENGLRSFEKYAFDPNENNYKGVNSSVKEIDIDASGEGFFDLHNAYVEITGEVCKANGGRFTRAELTANADNIAFANNSPFHMFNSAKLWLNDYQVEEIRDPGTVVTVLTPLLQDEDWLNSKATASSSIEENDNPGDANGNFALRQSQISSTTPENVGKFQFSMPLNMIFGFCDTNTKAISGARIKLRLTRGDNYENRAIFSDGAPGTASKISLISIRLIVPVGKLDNRYMAEYQEGLAEGRPIVINYLKRRLVESKITNGSRQSQIKVGAAESGTEPRFMITAFQPSLTDLNTRSTSPNSFLTLQTTKYRCRVNNQMFPERYETINFPTKDIIMPVVDADEFSSKYYDLTQKYAKSYINRELFETRYPFFIYDFRAIESDNKTTNTQYEVEFKLSEPTAGRARVCELLIIEAGTIQLTQRGSETDRVI